MAPTFRFDCKRCYDGKIASTECQACKGKGYHVAEVGSPATILYLDAKYPATVFAVTPSFIVVSWDMSRKHLSVPNQNAYKTTFSYRRGAWICKGYTLYVGEREHKPSGQIK